MKPEIESFTFTKQVPLADADGRAITEGSVLRHVDGGDSGVVTWIARSGKSLPITGIMASIGDIGIQKSPGSTRVTNQYSNWRHVPEDEQSYEQRHLSWLCRTYDHDDSREASKDEGRAIDGIMALLPPDTVDWNYGPFPDRIEDALDFLAQHLTELKAASTKAK